MPTAAVIDCVMQIATPYFNGIVAVVDTRLEQLVQRPPEVRHRRFRHRVIPLKLRSLGILVTLRQGGQSGSVAKFG